MKLKLIKGISYSGYGIKVTRSNPIIETDEVTGEKLVASGHFEVIEKPIVEKSIIPKNEKQPENEDEIDLFPEDETSGEIPEINVISETAKETKKNKK